MKTSQSSSDKLRKLRRIAGDLKSSKKPEGLPLIPIEYVGDEEPTKVEPRPDTIPPRSLPARAGAGVVAGWGSLPRPVQVLLVVLGAITALAQALQPFIK